MKTATALVARLAESKARAVVTSGTLVIGSDQVAVLDDRIIGKPGDHQQALVQLSQAAGRWLSFYTGVCVIDGDSGQSRQAIEHYQVLFRSLPTDALERYLSVAQPYQCAGSFKSEGLGITLFEKMAGDDPTTLIGLPLIALTRLLAEHGVALP